MHAHHQPVDERRVGDAPERDVCTQVTQLLEKKPGCAVEDAHLVSAAEQAADEVATRKAGTAGDEGCHTRTLRCVVVGHLF